jgi:hypothetical protein
MATPILGVSQAGLASTRPRRPERRRLTASIAGGVCGCGAGVGSGLGLAACGSSRTGTTRMLTSLANAFQTGQAGSTRPTTVSRMAWSTPGICARTSTTSEVVSVSGEGAVSTLSFRRVGAAPALASVCAIADP